MGVAFSYDIANGTYTKLADFSPALGSNPRCDIMEATIGVTGIASTSAPQVLVYVDAATHQLSVISYQLSGKAELEVYNTIGEKIYAQEITSQKTEINLSSQRGGIYFVQLRSNEQTVTRKIILSK